MTPTPSCKPDEPMYLIRKSELDVLYQYSKDQPNIPSIDANVRSRPNSGAQQQAPAQCPHWWFEQANARWRCKLNAGNLEYEAAIAAQARKEGYAEGAASSPKFKLLESIPDKNGFVIFGAKEDPEGHFVSREKAIEFMLIKDREIEQKIAQAAGAERERVYKRLESLAYQDFEGGHKIPVVDWPDIDCLFAELRSQPEKQPECGTCTGPDRIGELWQFCLDNGVDVRDDLIGFRGEAGFLLLKILKKIAELRQRGNK